jgi:hypothetical protein
VLNLPTSGVAGLKKVPAATRSDAVTAGKPQWWVSLMEMSVIWRIKPYENGSLTNKNGGLWQLNGIKTSA